MKLEQLIASISSPKENLNLHWNAKRLIIIALIRSNFDIEEARKLNCPETEFETYRTMVYRIVGSQKKLKELCVAHKDEIAAYI